MSFPNIFVLAEKTPVADETTPRAVPMAMSASSGKMAAAADKDQSFEFEGQSMLEQLQELSV